MVADPNPPCELILKIGCNESDEIASALASLLRSCTIVDQIFFSIERQIQPTTYFGSFTTSTLRSKVPIQCQSLSCVIFLSEDAFQQYGKKDLFKSGQIWNFHHKIELLDEYRHTIARQDYYELSHLLPLWSVSHIPHKRQIIVRFNIFTKNFDAMLRFYKHLFQRPPDSSKSGFVLFNLSSPVMAPKVSYQLSIKYSPSIESYTISQGAYLKFRLTHANHFIHEYTSKLFTINKCEYYIHDPDGNLLHLCLQNTSTNAREALAAKPLAHPNDSGFGDSSDPSIHLLKSNISAMCPISHDVDDQSHSSNDSGQCSSISSSDIHAIRRTVHHNPAYKTNSISVRPATRSEIDCRLKQQQRTVLSRVVLKPSVYESESRIRNINDPTQCYSSMNNVKRFQHTRPCSAHHFYPPIFSQLHCDDDISYEVDSPRIESETSTSQSTFSYLNAFLSRKQQSVHSQNVKQLIAQFEQPEPLTMTFRPKSVPLAEHSLPFTLLPQPIHRTVTPAARNQPVAADWEDDDNDVLSTTGEQEQRRSPRINIGITLDSRLRKTPVLNMLRSTTMQSDPNESQQLLRTSSFRHSFAPIARF